ncbi:MAG: T9SS type A sorting domain-containing protein, partial [Sphingobacteriales bacterium]
FSIERSADAVNFMEVGSAKANGSASSYSFWDEQPVTGINYYRIRMTDASGASSYSSIVSAMVKGNQVFEMNAFPNPVKDVLTVSISGNMGANAVVTLSDVSGRVIKMLDLASSQVQIDTRNLAAGVYFIRYQDADKSETVKVTKQ